MKTEEEMKKIDALSKYLECEIEEAERWIDNEDYKVFTDSEADEACSEYIKETLWAFTPRFIAAHVIGSCNHIDALIQAIECMQEKMCESCNDVLYCMIGDKMSDFIEEAISADGRGHFLSPYDAEENEQGEYFIYRCN